MYGCQKWQDYTILNLAVRDHIQMMQSLITRLGVPAQTLRRLSLCEPNKEDIAIWLESLPQGNLGETCRNLYKILGEVVRLKIDVETRLEILEALRPSVMKAAARLAKHYLHQPVILSEKSQQVVDLSMAMRQNLIHGYLLTAFELHSQIKEQPNNSRNIANGKQLKVSLASAVFQAMRLISDNFLVQYQLYVAVQENAWLTLHQLFKIASVNKVQTIELPISPIDKSSIENQYTHALLLGCIKANQLRQDDLTTVDKLLPQWTKLVTLEDSRKTNSPALFLANLDADNSPVFAHLLKKDALSKYALAINTSALVENMRKLIETASDNKTQIGNQAVSIDLLKHLILAWGQCSKRSFMRMESNATLEISMGLSATHYFASGESGFEQMVVVAKAAVDTPSNLTLLNPESKADGDLWATHSDSGRWPGDAPIIEKIDYQLPGFSNESDGSVDEEKLRCVKVKIVNASPGGYSLCWPDTDNGKLQAGDLVCLREEKKSHWSIATIRWIHRPNKTDLQFGIELLSPAYKPTVARATYKDKEPGTFTRALLLPAISVTAQPSSVVLPNMRYRNGQSIQVLNGDKVQSIKLIDKLAQTGAYAQYTYSVIEAANDQDMDSDQSDNQFNALWSSL